MNSKTQEKVELVKVFKSQWNPSEGEVVSAYIHGQTQKGSGIGKIGTIVHLSREDKQSDPELDRLASQLAMHVAAMKPAYMKQEDIPEEVKNEILESEDGKKKLKKYIKRDVLWMQDLATADKSVSVGDVFSRYGKANKTKLILKNWQLFMIE